MYSNKDLPSRLLRSTSRCSLATFFFRTPDDSRRCERRGREAIALVEPSLSRPSTPAPLLASRSPWYFWIARVTHTKGAKNSLNAVLNTFKAYT